MHPFTVTPAPRPLIARPQPASAIPATMIADATRLATLNASTGLRPVIGWFQRSPRRGSFGIRFQPAPAFVDLGSDGTFTPILSF